MSQTFTLYVQYTKNSFAIIEFIHKNIAMFSRMGVTIKINVLEKGESPNIFNDLKENKIESLPAMKAHGGKMLVGCKAIHDYFNRNLTEARRKRKTVAEKDYDYRSQIYDELYDKDGRPRHENENEKEQTDDVLKEFNTKRNHYIREGNGERQRLPPSRPDRYEEDFDQQDNVGTYNNYDDMRNSADPDDKIQAAYMQNNGSGGYLE